MQKSIIQSILIIAALVVISIFSGFLVAYFVFGIVPLALLLCIAGIASKASTRAKRIALLLTLVAISALAYIPYYNFTIRPF